MVPGEKVLIGWELENGAPEGRVPGGKMPNERRLTCEPENENETETVVAQGEERRLPVVGVERCRRRCAPDAL